VDRVRGEVGVPWRRGEEGRQGRPSTGAGEAPVGGMAGGIWSEGGREPRAA